MLPWRTGRGFRAASAACKQGVLSAKLLLLTGKLSRLVGLKRAAAESRGAVLIAQLVFEKGLHMKTQAGAHAYSNIIACVYDEPEGLGNLYGYHYSVFRTVVLVNEAGNVLPRNQLHHCAVIWDDDHDTRIISVVEQLYIANLLRTIAFIGEHKGEVNVLFAPVFAMRFTPQQQEAYRREITKIIANPFHGDSWTTQFGQFIPAKQANSACTTVTANLLGMESSIEDAYLNHIHNMWRLGVREFQPSDSAWKDMAQVPAWIAPPNPSVPQGTAAPWGTQ